jgi:hypothetical protein
MLAAQVRLHQTNELPANKHATNSVESIAVRDSSFAATLK